MALIRLALLHAMSWACEVVDRAGWLPEPVRSRLGCPTGLALRAARLADRWGVPWAALDRGGA